MKTCRFDRTLIALPDDRPGKAAPWHRMIHTRADLSLTFDRGNGPEGFDTHGYARFYVVRGDSALLTPSELAAGGRDTSRWWLERWDDETVPPSGSFGSQPTLVTSWGWLKAIFR